MRFRSFGRLHVRGVTSRRLAAAKRALKRERDRHPLFRDQVLELQPTAEERIWQADLDLIEYDQGHRELAAKHWRWGRKKLREHLDVAGELLERWNTHRWLPADAWYFADFVRTELKRRGLLD